MQGWARRRYDALAGTTHRASCGKHIETTTGEKLAELTALSLLEDETLPASLFALPCAHFPSASSSLTTFRYLKLGTPQETQDNPGTWGGVLLRYTPLCVSMLRPYHISI